MKEFATFVCALIFFHTSEFLLCLTYNPGETTKESWLFSRAYCVAMTAAIVEYLVERTLFPSLKAQFWVSAIGLFMITLGELIRKSAIYTAKTSFTHKIKHQRRPCHTLITTGIYRYFRHPGYFGWMLWAVGTQVLLVNPICVALFTFWAWTFFSQRIPFEEELLLQMFGQEYEMYASKTHIWMPINSRL